MSGLFDDDEPPVAKVPEAKKARRAPRSARSSSAASNASAEPHGPSFYASVALPRPMRVEYTYRVPAPLAAEVRAGMRVRVPFARKSEIAVVVATSTTTDVDPALLKSIEAVLDAEPVVGADLLELTRWMADEYACSWGEALAAALPAPLKRARTGRRVRTAAATPTASEHLAALEESSPKQFRLLRKLLEVGGPIDVTDLLRSSGLSQSPLSSLVERGLVAIDTREALVEFEPGADRDRPRPAALGEGQQWAVDAIELALASAARGAAGSGFLLQGVTGSGKTEVYLQVIERALALGRGAICLVPEIALTPQTVGWFESRFGRVAVLHSRLSDAQRFGIWQRVRRGELRVVVGARSAVFAPVVDLGVIVVDEEHEPSFKQGNAPRYNARDVAIERARRCGAVCILGSATPSLESWQAATDGELKRLRLESRVGGGALPQVHVVDMRSEPIGRVSSIFSRHLRQRFDATLAAGEQAILFLNRRGFSPVLWCPACRAVVRCKECDSSLTFHRHIGRLVCHQCHHEERPPQACPSCTAPGLRMLGAGSERVEEVLRELWPNVRARRMDSDTMLRREDYEEVLSAFGRRELDVLVGTQMIAKGLDFPGVTLVGIVSADTSLHLPDFRAAERTFQLLAQVAGRAGRGTSPGHIVVQTENPEHAAIRCAARHDFEAFAAEECVSRRELGYPPFGRLIRVVLEDEDASKVASEADRLAQDLRALLEGPRAEANDATAVVLGPAPAPMSLLRNRHRHHILVKVGAGRGVKTRKGLKAARELLCERAAQLTRPRVLVDVDPTSML